jgi:hypothetical protein
MELRTRDTLTEIIDGGRRIGHITDRGFDGGFFIVYFEIYGKNFDCAEYEEALRRYEEMIFSNSVDRIRVFPLRGGERAFFERNGYRERGWVWEKERQKTEV